jgi:hypothetical protein
LQPDDLILDADILVAELPAMLAKVDALKPLQAQTQVRYAVDALLPSVLDRAFKGELL